MKGQIFAQTRSYVSIVGLGLCLALTTNPIFAQKNMDREIATMVRESSFNQIEQPMGLKIAVVLGGLGLIGAELWWFMFHQTKSSTAQVKQKIKEVDLIVDSGDEH